MASTRVAAMRVLVGAGLHEEFETFREIVTAQKGFLRNRNNFDIYDEIFHDYKNLYHTLRKKMVQGLIQEIKKYIIR